MTIFPEDLIRSVTVETSSKILLVVIDGLGGLPVDGRTELEVGSLPNLDRLASQSICGLIDPIAPGITPGSGPSHLALFGYDPVRYQIGRGVLEAVGVGMDLEKGDLAARGNFATVDSKGTVVDRRAGRISTERNQQLCRALQKQIETIEGVRVIIESGREHRFVVVFRGDDLNEGLTDADPQKEGKKAALSVALHEGARRSASVVNGFIKRATELLQGHPPSNTVLLRGFSQVPDIPNMRDLFKIRAGAIASYPMYRGLARLVGMEILETGETVEDEINTIMNHFEDFEFFFFHIKEPDIKGEDGDFQGKVAALEKIDTLIPEIVKLEPDVLAITGDHSTPSILGSHSWHPNPVIIFSKYVRTDSVVRFTERECAIGGLGRIPAVNLIPILLANALKMKKFGA
ncbi:MAG: 2,3-bisphosphoglycerate-independent phosphoglycerate mutase [Proteobacteria bacterium]|nr:2,3-bisphosphoglycerate-independent phosphoglycerate mutase [Pseudomonadota bacterium]NIS68013.1 2,3-bisphosphoglycerate-independent phosphoglycerate mutase [Pseudomonadota bacterium]